MDQIPVTVLLMLLAFMGCLVGGPNNIITSAVAADLADDPSIKGSNKSLGTVTGIINGITIHHTLSSHDIFIFISSGHNYVYDILSLTDVTSLHSRYLTPSRPILHPPPSPLPSFVKGSGSVTAALGQLAIPVLYTMGIKDGVGYRYVWFFLILCTAVGTSLLSPRIFRELYPSRETEPLNVSSPVFLSMHLDHVNTSHHFIVTLRTVNTLFHIHQYNTHTINTL